MQIVRTFFLFILLAFSALPVAPAAYAGPAEELKNELIYRTNLGRAEDVRLLIEEGANPNQKNPDGVPLIILAASRKDEEGINVMQALLDKGADINGTDVHGQTALFYASKHGNLGAVNFLLSKGINYYAADIHGDIARNIAHKAGHSKILEAMDQFVQDQTTKIKRQYDEFNKTVEKQYQDQIKAVEERNKELAAAQEEAAKAQEEENEEIVRLKQETLEQYKKRRAEILAARAAKAAERAAEKRAEKKEHAEKRETSSYDKDMTALAFNNCAFQYWSFVYSTKQTTELSLEELKLAIDSRKDKILDQYDEITDDYGVTRKYLLTVSNTAKKRINNTLANMPSRSYRFERGVGKMDDMNQRCHEVALQWDMDTPREEPTKKADKDKSAMGFGGGFGGGGGNSNPMGGIGGAGIKNTKSSGGKSSSTSKAPLNNKMPKATTPEANPTLPYAGLRQEKKDAEAAAIEAANAAAKEAAEKKKK